MLTRPWLLMLVANSVTNATLPAQQQTSPPPRRLTMHPTPLIRGETHGIETMAWIAASRAGRIAITDRGLYRVLIFSPQGALEATVGRRGEGPGEFMDMSGGGWVAETLWINDQRRMMTTFIGPGGKVLRSVRWPIGITGSLPQPVMPGAGLATRPRGISSSGDLILFLPVRPSTGMTFSSSTMIARSRPDGAIAQVLGTTSRSCSIKTENAAISTLVCGIELSQISSDGELFLTVRDEKAPSTSTSAVRVVLGNRLGQVLFDRLINRPAYVMPARMRDSIITFLKGKRTFSGTDAGEDADRSLPKGATIAMVSRTEVGSDSTVWLLMNSPSGEFWQLIDAKGRDIATIAHPRNVTLREVGRRSALGIIRNDDDVPTLVRFTWR